MFSSVVRKHLSIYVTTWACESALQLQMLWNSYADHLFLLKIVSEMRCAVSIEYTLEFEDLILKVESKISH